MTAAVARPRDGTVNFREDVYKHDEALDRNALADAAAGSFAVPAVAAVRATRSVRPNSSLDSHELIGEAWHSRPSSRAHRCGLLPGESHQTVQRCVERALAYGALAALDDSPRPGKEPEITLPARAWLVSLACQKAKDVGYPHELWTTRLLARHSREHGPAAGHASLARIAQGTVCKLLAEQEVKPHKVRYYLERRDPEFEAKMAEVLCVYQEVAILRAVEARPPKLRAMRTRRRSRRPAQRCIRLL